MGFDAVGWTRLGLRSLWPDLVEQGLANVRVLGSHRSTEKKLNVLPKYQLDVHPCHFDETSDPNAGLEGAGSDSHAVAGDHLASNAVVFATDKNLADLGIR